MKFSDLFGRHNSDVDAKGKASDAFAAAKAGLDSATASEASSDHDLGVAVAASKQAYELLPQGGIRVYTSTGPTTYAVSTPVGPDGEVPPPPAATATPAE